MLIQKILNTAESMYNPVIIIFLIYYNYFKAVYLSKKSV